MSAAVTHQRTETEPHSCPWTGRWTVDADRSSLRVGVKVGLFATAHGRFTEMAGVAVLTGDPADCTVDVTVTTSSLTSGSGTMDALLRGAGIVDCAANPELGFTSTAIRPTRSGWELDGELLTAGGILALTLAMTDPEPVGDDLKLRATGSIATCDAIRLLSHPGLGTLLGRSMSLDLQIVLVRS